MTHWFRGLGGAIWSEEPTAREAAVLAAFVVIVPFGWLVLLVRPIRRILRSR
jgi:hypothetical protein